MLIYSIISNPVFLPHCSIANGSYQKTRKDLFYHAIIPCIDVLLQPTVGYSNVCMDCIVSLTSYQLTLLTLTRTQVLPPSINGNALSGDEGGILRGKEGDQFSHLIRLGDAPQCLP